MSQRALPALRRLRRRSVPTLFRQHLWLELGEWNTRMSKFDQLYRRNAEEAQRQADQATSEEIRAAWLQVVQGWLALLPKRDLSREQALDVQVSDQNRFC